MDIAGDIIRTHAIVWDYRRRLAERWPTPGRIDSLRFAFTEAGEAMDAHRRQNPIYARNNSRNMDEADELADCAMMLCTAMGDVLSQKWLPLPGDLLYMNTSLSGVCIAVADTLQEGDVIRPLALIAYRWRMPRT